MCIYKELKAKILIYIQSLTGFRDCMCTLLRKNTHNYREGTIVRKTVTHFEFMARDICIYIYEQL